MKKKLKPTEYAEYVMEQMGWSQADLSKMGMGIPSHISEMLTGKRSFTKKFIKDFTEKSHRENMAWHLL